MRGRWHRARSLPIAGASSCLALVGVIAASAGIGYAPPIHPGEVALTLYPHATIALPSAVARDASGRFVAAVTQPVSGGAADPAAGGLTVDRLTPDGSRVAGWTYSDREWTSGPYAGYGEWSAVHVYDDGSVLAAGFMEVPYTLPCNPCGGQTQVVLRRFDPKGSVDSSFGSGGRETPELCTGDHVESLPL